MDLTPPPPDSTPDEDLDHSSLDRFSPDYRLFLNEFLHDDF